MLYIKKLFKWLDKNIIELLAGFLLIFIPLYPKWPLADVLPGYIVRLRLEDIIIAIILLSWSVQLVRKKVSIKKNPLFLPIVLYLAIGFISSLSALFITKTVPLETIHVSKLFLHWLRRVEYMSLAFIFFSAVKTPRQLKRLISIFSVVIVIAATYGMGQKYFQWPVYSTMNREFAKGWRLVLTEHARVPSTFAGHYDFAAYLVIALALVVSIAFFTASSKKIKIGYFLVFLAGFLSLLLTASRTSFIAYLIAITVVIAMFAFRKGIIWSLTRWSVIVAISMVGMLYIGELSQRFAHVLRIDQIKDYIQFELLNMDKTQAEQGIEISGDLALVYTQTDQPPIRYELPPGVFENIPLAPPEATLSATSNKEKLATLAGVPRTYSSTAFAFGLSSAIRFDALWPRAIKGFKTNPLLGSGYSTLIKTQVTQFTEAESTDNDYLRALGETGLLGFLSFFGIIIFSMITIWKKRKTIKDPFQFAVLVGIMGAIIGMLVNGLYIDVFEASKVAYTFWALMGMLFAIIGMPKKKVKYG